MFNRARTEGHQPHQILRALAAPEDLSEIDEVLSVFDGVVRWNYEVCFEIFREDMTDEEVAVINSVGRRIVMAIDAAPMALKKKACQSVLMETLDYAVEAIEGSNKRFSRGQFAMFRATCDSGTLLARGSNPPRMVTEVVKFGLLWTLRIRDWEHCVKHRRWLLGD